MTNTLNPFDGRAVVGTSIRVTNAGDGLSTAMKVEAKEYHTGEKVYVLMETEVGPIAHVPSKDNPQAYIRQHTLKAGTATIVDERFAIDKIDEQRVANERALGVERLPLDDGGDIEDPETLRKTLSGPTNVADLAKETARKAAMKARKDAQAAGDES